MKIGFRVQGNTKVLEKISKSFGYAEADLAKDIQMAVLEHVVLTEAALPESLKGKIRVNFHYIPGQGYLINYGINSEPSTRLTRKEGNVFVPGPNEQKGAKVQKSGIERPPITRTLRGKVIEAATAASAQVRRIIPKIVPRTQVNRMIREGIKVQSNTRRLGSE